MQMVLRDVTTFNPVSDGYRGKLLRNTVIDGSTVNADGVWTVNGVVQTK